MFSAAEDMPTPPSEVTDAGLLEEVQSYLAQCLGGTQDKADAWLRFYRIYEPLIRGFARRCRLPDDEQDDCVQETLQTVIVALRDFKYDRERGRFRGWLFSVVRSRATDLMRRRLRRDSRRAADSPDEQADPSADVVAELERRWRSAVIQTVIEQLREEVSATNFEVFNLRSVEGLPTPEVAARLKMAPEKVRYRHHRTFRKFRDLYLNFTGEKYED